MGARLKDIPQLKRDGSNLHEFADAVLEVLQTFRGYRGDPMDKALTLRHVEAGALVGARGVSGGSTTIVGGGGGGGGGGIYTPDPTPPPTASGLVVTAGLSHIYIEQDNPTYTEGNGHDRTIVLGAKWPAGDPEPTFSDAVELFRFQGNFAAYPSATGTTWCIWIKWLSRDQYESAIPHGGTNGVQATTGKIGNIDLGPLVVEAANLADNAVIEQKIADGSVGMNKLADNAVSVGKLLVTGKGPSLNADPHTVDPSAWFWGVSQPTFAAAPWTPNGRYLGNPGVRQDVFCKPFSIDALKNYEASIYCAQDIATTATCYLAIAFYDSALVSITGSNIGWPSYGAYYYFGLFNQTMPLGALLKYAVSFGPNETAQIPAGAVYASIGVLFNWNSGTGTQYISYPRVMEKTSADLIVDGAILARHLSAGSIAVGTAAIQNGAIVNAMIGNLQVDDAKIANMSVAKLAAGSMQVGSWIRSTSYVPGSSGWAINANGSAEFASASIRGTLTAGQLEAGIFQTDNVHTRGLTVRDGSGNIILAAGSGLPAGYLPVAGRNLLDPSQWVIGSGGGQPGFFHNAEGSTSSVIDIVQAPDGSYSPGWLSYAGSGGTGADGGWNTGYFPVDPTKTYRFSVWVRRISGTGAGSFYFGPGYSDTVRDAGSLAVNNNPYFVVAGRGVLADSEWYLLVGYVFNAGYAAGNAQRGGMYLRSTGQKVQNGNDFCWKDGTITQAVQRAYQFYTTTSNRADFWGPRVDLCDGNEPSLDALLSGGSISARNPITDANVSTYIASAAIGLAHIDTASIGNLSALSAALGTITSGNITLNTTSSIKGGQTAYNTGTGFFLGYDGAAYKFSLGSGANMMTWDGSTLRIPAANITGTLTTSQIQVGAVTQQDVASAGYIGAGLTAGSTSYSGSTEDILLFNASSPSHNTRAIGYIKGTLVVNNAAAVTAIITWRLIINATTIEVGNEWVKTFPIMGGVFCSFRFPVVYMEDGFMLGVTALQFRMQVDVEWRNSANTPVSCGTGGSFGALMYLTVGENKV